MQVNRSNDMKVIDNRYTILDKQLKGSDLEVGKLYADLNDKAATIMQLVKLDESTLSFKYVAGMRIYYLSETGTIDFSNIDYSPWFEVNDLQSTNK